MSETYLLARSASVVLQWRVDGNTTTKHGSGISAVQPLGNVEDKSAGVTSIGGVTTVGLSAAVLVLVAVCVGNVYAVVLFTILAILAFSTAVRLSADTD